MRSGFLLCLVFLVFQRIGFGQIPAGTWAKVKVFLDRDRHTLTHLAALGVETDHGLYKPGHFFTSAFSGKELERIRRAGFRTEVLVKDVSEDFRNRTLAAGGTHTVQTDYFSPSCNRVKARRFPRFWRFGSMGGHLTYSQMLQQLDSMRIRFPQLISAREAIDTTRTHEGRTIWGIRISDNPSINEPEEPQALFTAIHHAREPVGMHQLLFFMWYLLENYATDPEIKNLVDRSDLYFVPCLNPDGYIFNELTNPDGGGMWRKNRRDHGGALYGVDLNRNYGYNWGFDDFGSSPDPDTETYRGASAFSEPESQAMRALSERKSFKIALNYHTYSNLLIHPWGYQDIQCEDSILFRKLTREMVQENNYRPGTGMQVLNYNSNGSSDDYMYAPIPGKDKIMAMTPEAGDWFWPLKAEIPGLCLENLHQNLTAVRALHPLVRFRDTTGLFLKAGANPGSGPFRIRYKLDRIGTDGSPASFTLRLVPIGANAGGIPVLSRTYSDLVLQETRIDSLVFPDGTPGLDLPTALQWEVQVSNGVFTQIDTIQHFGGEHESPTSLWEPCENATEWDGNWVIQTSGAQQGSGFLKPTPGLYSADMRSFATRKRPFDLRPSHIRGAEMSFWTRFDIEQNFDYASLSFSVDSGLTWTNVCTDKTVLSSPFSNQAGQDSILPIWDGIQRNWRKEYVDLRDYLGQKLWIRFLFRSDAFEERDGFSVDNIRIQTHRLTTGVSDRESRVLSIGIVPNPGGSQSGFTLTGIPKEGVVPFRIRDLQGKLVFEGNTTPSGTWTPSQPLPPGCYWVEVISKEKRSAFKPARWVVNY